MCYNSYMTYNPQNAKHIKRNRKYQHEWYLRNKALQIQRNKERKLKMQQRFRDFKATLHCKKCGENHPACLSFHHRDPKQKKGRMMHLISNAGWGWEKLLTEIAKCDILCENCHRKLHWDELSGPHANRIAASLL